MPRLALLALLVAIAAACGGPTVEPLPQLEPTTDPTDTEELAAEPIVDETIEIDPEEPDYRSDEGLQ
jgi:hypothetical protein